MRTSLWIVSALAGAALLAACSDGAGVADPADPSERRDPLVEQLVGMGFRRDQIEDRGDHFVVEGDIQIGKKNFRAAAPVDAKARPGGPRYQRVVSTLASNRRLIRVDLSAVAAVSTSWANATRAAMSNWSSINGVDLAIVEGGGPTDITVSFVSSLGNCTVALGSWPASGAPGSTVQISQAYLNSYSYAKQVWIMTHELGHNVGLGHTDQSGTLVSGTPSSDAGSVMNSGGFYGGCPPAAPDWWTFSYYDAFAVRSLYPLPVPTPTVADVSGQAVVSWNSLSGATSYTVRRITASYGQDEFGTFTSYGNSGTVTGVSSPFTDTGWTYTGNFVCRTEWESYYWMETTYGYVVDAHFPTGTSSGEVAAATGVC
jgi:hypothetical protein